MKRTAIAMIAVATALMCGEADAAEGDVCPPAGTAWLRVAFAGDGFTAALRSRVVEQFVAELRVHGLVLCDAGGDPSRPAPLADVALTLSSDLILSLEVHDAVTHKQMTRALPLASVPPDALALSITLAAEELLHASWIEAALAPRAGAPVPVTFKPVPPAVQAVNADEIARMPQGERAAPSRHSERLRIAILGALERATGDREVRGQTDLGGDLRVTWGGRFVASARVGARAAPDVGSVHGTVRGRELVAGVGASYAFVPREAAWGGEIGARADGIDVLFSGVDAVKAKAANGAALGVVASATLGGWRHLGGRWRLVAETALGAPIHAVTASDAGAAATGVSGVVISGAIGIAATLPE